MFRTRFGFSDKLIDSMRKKKLNFFINTCWRFKFNLPSGKLYIH